MVSGLNGAARVREEAAAPILEDHHESRRTQSEILALGRDASYVRARGAQSGRRNRIQGCDGLVMHVGSHPFAKHDGE